LKADTAEDVKKRWDEIKKEEKAVKGHPAETRSMLEDVPRFFPALVEAAKISNKAAAAGFEWPHIGGVVEKLQEEAAELAEARAGLQPEEVAHELGDLLFTMVNLARFLKVDPEQALRRANARFRERFAYIEQQLEASGKTMAQTSLEELEKLWQEGKALKANSSSRVRHD
jgi:MazG family protein